MRGRKFTEDLRWAAICAQHHGLNPIATSSSCISAFPALQEWFASIDGDPTRCICGNEYSQYSHTFDLHGFKSLLDLEGVGPDQLFEQFGISEAAARRLLNFAEEDIRYIRDGVYTPRTRA